MIVEELVAMLGFKVKGTGDLEKARKAYNGFIKDVRKGSRSLANDLGRTTKLFAVHDNALKMNDRTITSLRKATDRLGGSVRSTALGVTGLSRSYDVAGKSAKVARVEFAKADLAARRSRRAGLLGSTALTEPRVGRRRRRAAEYGATGRSGGGSRGGSSMSAQSAALAGGILGRATGPTLGAIAVGEGLRRAAKSSMDFERTLIEVGKATDSKGPELDAYAESLMKLARETGKTKEELGSMLASAGFAGRPGNELMRFTEFGAKATVAWGTSAEETGQALAELGNIYQADQKRIEEIGDAINTMADKSASKESDLLEFTRRAGASANQAGISAEPLLAFGAAMKEVGVRNEVAATGFEALLNVMKLGEEFSKSAGEGLEELGIKSDKMRKAFVAKPVETMVGLLEKLNKVSDPLKKAEIMTNLFGKEYQDDIAKLLNALPKIKQYLDLMQNKSNSAGSVRRQFSENLDKDVSKIDKATQAIDVMMKRLGDPIKSGAGGIAEQINKMVEGLEQGDTILQRLMKRLNGGGEGGKPIELPEMNGEGDLEKWVEKNFPFLSGKKWNETIDGAIGKTGADAERMNGEDARAAERAKEQAILDKPAEIEARMRAQSGLAGQAQGATGFRRTMLADQAKKAEGEIARLQGELVQAKEAAAKVLEKRSEEQKAIEATKAQLESGKRLQGFTPDGARGTPGAITPGLGTFGFGKYGTSGQTDGVPKADPNSKRVPVPPTRPSEFTSPSGTTGTIDQISDVLGKDPIKIKVDASEVEGAKTTATQAGEVMKTSLNGNYHPSVDVSSITAAIAVAEQLRAALAGAASAGVGVARAAAGTTAGRAVAAAGRPTAPSAPAGPVTAALRRDMAPNVQVAKMGNAQQAARGRTINNQGGPVTVNVAQTNASPKEIGREVRKGTSQDIGWSVNANEGFA